MPIWIIYAILSAVFAGITAILAKYGLENVNADLGLGIRTTTIFFIITAINLIGSKYKDIAFCSIILTLIIAFGIFHQASFIYFQF